MWVVVAAAGGTESSRRSPTLARTSSESTSFRSASATAAGEVCGLNVRLHELARELCGHERNLREIEGDALRPVLLARRRHTHTTERRHLAAGASTLPYNLTPPTTGSRATRHALSFVPNCRLRKRPTLIGSSSISPCFIAHRPSLPYIRLSATSHTCRCGLRGHATPAPRGHGR